MRNENKIKNLRSHSAVAHAFATHGMDSDNWGGSGSMFFDDSTIYSYGRHFAIAKFIAHDVLLFVDHTYSNSTSKHIGHTSSATSQYTKLYVNDPHASLMTNISKAENEIEQHVRLIGGAKRGGRREWYDAVNAKIGHLKAIRNYLLSLANDNEYFQENQACIGRIDTIINNFDGLTKDNKSDFAQKLIEREQQRQVEMAKLEAKQAKERTIKFMNGEINHFASQYQIMRVEGDNVRTSLNIILSVDVVKRAYELYKRSELEKVEQWKVLSNDGKVIRIGCHVFEKKYIDTFMQTIK